MIARELHALNPIRIREVGAQHTRRITASLDVNEQHRVVCPVRGVTRVVVTHVYVGAVVEVAGASLPAGAPAAVGQADELFPSRRDAGDGLRHEVRRQRRNGRVHVQGHQEQQRGTSCHSDHGQQARRIEQRLLPAGLAGCGAALLRLGQLLELAFAKLLLLIQEQFRAAAPHGHPH